MSKCAHTRRESNFCTFFAVDLQRCNALSRLAACILACNMVSGQAATRMGERCTTLVFSDADASHVGVSARQQHAMIRLSLQAATDIRKEVNVLDNQTTGKAVDALLNYETVALFNNQVTTCSKSRLLLGLHLLSCHHSMHNPGPVQPLSAGNGMSDN